MGKQRKNRQDECSHLISAKITDDAFEIYKFWRANRQGGRRISNAICAFELNTSKLKQERLQLQEKEKQYLNENIAQRSRIISMEKNIEAIQKIITRTFGERDDLAAELAEMYCPQRPE